MWRIQSLVGRVLSRCHGNAQLRLSQGHHVEDEVISSSILTSGRHASDSSSSHRGEDGQKKKRTSRFCYTGLPRYSALDAVGWGAAAVLFVQLCRRIHSQLSSDQNPGVTRIRDAGLVQKCSYRVLVDVLSRPNALSGDVAKCLCEALQAPESRDSDRSHGNSDGDVTSDLQTAHSSDDQQEEPASAASHSNETLFPEQPEPEERLSLDAAAQNLRLVADSSVPVILNIIGLESARAGDYETAFSCFLASAQHDYSKAQFNLGVCYERGRGVQADLSKAVHYYRRAAVAGHRQAQYRCAKLLLGSRGQQSSETDAAAALSFLQTAADAGLTEAQVFLGVVLSQRSDCDERKCVHYFRMAAESGDSVALVCLAQCYETGFGVSPCLQTAVRLYHQAAAGGNQQARDKLRDGRSRDVLRSIRSAPCFSAIGQLHLDSMFPQESHDEKPCPQQRSDQSQPLPHSWSTGSLSVLPSITLQMLRADSSRKLWTLGV
ncbi:death ligand signal enhancer [Onychostoma macrolepis]|uniref:Death ligand signal enhancer n=1 Tax=Onychostoma macrolepis TaxID=369639 RepID=A0A7J6CBZ3_9TELE|nr:death ligand signal enhancer [Onychostoma macrolepis]KAF4104594.1 hypothetical protein G5714_013925 [Onychostoma macrolepis]